MTYWKVKQILPSKGIIVFFITIIQFLFAMSTELMVLAADDDSPTHDRLADIFAVLFLFSSNFLFFGISLSIQRALDVESSTVTHEYDDDESSIFLD